MGRRHYESRQRSKNFLALAAPIAVFTAPLNIAKFGYLAWRDWHRGIRVELMDPGLAFVLVASLAGFLVAIWYCREELGWFKAKNNGVCN